MAISLYYCDNCGAANQAQATACFACGWALQTTATSPSSSQLPTPVAVQLVPAAAQQAMVPAAKAFNAALAPDHLLKQRYRIIGQVGKGGFGAVYKATDIRSNNRLLAVKEVNPSGQNPQGIAEATAAFKREALLLTGLAHQSLPHIYDHFSEAGSWYLAMDFIEGETLEERLSKTPGGRLPLEKALSIGIQLCSVLDYLHTRQQPIIFRALKPGNIMPTPGGLVSLIDFGIARHFKAGQVTKTQTFGSPGYAAPEQYGKAQTTPRSDIYGLGATLHQLLTGDDPSLNLFHFAPVRLYSSPISTPLNALLQQMLEMEMDKRPASMTVVKQELQRLLAPQTAQKPGPVVKRRTFVKGCLGVVATCSASIAITTFIVKNPNLVDLLFAHPFSGTTPVPSLSPPAPAQATILSRPLYTYRGHAGSVTAVAWSPHGQNIASAGTLDSSVQVWDAPTVFFPDPTPIVRDRFAMNNQSVDALAWSPNGSSIAAALGKDTVDIWSIETRDPSTIPFSQP